MEKIWILAVCLAAVRHNEGYKILIVPTFTGFNSHMLKMEHMADLLSEDGHQVSVLLNDRVLHYKTTKYANVISFKVSEDAEVFTDMSTENFQFGGLAIVYSFYKMILLQVPFCDSLYRDKVVMNHLQEEKFDLIIADRCATCNLGLISHLNTSSIWVQNTGFFGDHYGSYPQFPSFTCLVAGSVCYIDEMTFMEKTLNTAFLVAFHYFVIPYILLPSQYRIAEAAGLDLKLSFESIIKERIMVIPSIDFVLDTPRPTMPHIFLMPGLHVKTPRPLEAYFQKIIDKSGDHGTIIMSFGTIVPRFNSKKAEIFARVFGQLKQQVIWRYTGAKPKGLRENTHIVKWFPQNDLLANPRVKLFISHCGIASVTEMAYHAVPVIAFPLNFEQPYNAMKLTHRVKMGIMLDYHKFTDVDLENAIHEILTNPIYHENAQRASALVTDHMVSPVHQFRHVVNMTIKSGGAKHLFHPYAGRMNWITFYGIDIMLFLVGVIVLILYFLFYILRRMFTLMRETKVKIKQR